MNKPKIYISGAITGIPDLNKAAFAQATKTFRDLGYIVVNPHELCDGLTEDQWSLCMRRCITALMDCDVVIMLDNWYGSRGALVEYQIAFSLGMEVFNQKLFLEGISATSN
ncbi:DUF4406 domain-containing protein [Pedobacter ginsengisoli]|uniref:DUF4406 domain-containing protein n=1 Tax=Pedobacter ginsengisoli TaxID=363852 RepID=UPI00254F4035|nr:DUF4406 domain-containing protein [Pedobacter ginsengisoli]